MFTIYGAGSNDFDAGNIHYEGHWKGWALKWQLAKPKKGEISGPTPSNGLSNGFARIKIIKSKRHIKRRLPVYIIIMVS